MLYFEPTVKVIHDPDPLLKIERMARVCYKSEDKISEGSAERLIRNIIKRGHESTLEHYRFAIVGYDDDRQLLRRFYEANPVFLKLEDCNYTQKETYLVADGKRPFTKLIGNVRALRDTYRQHHDYFAIQTVIQALANKYPVLFADLLPETPYVATHFEISEAEDYLSFVIESDRGVLGEYSRHRVESSPSVESTRYCRYKDGIAIMLPDPFPWSPSFDKAGHLRQILTGRLVEEADTKEALGVDIDTYPEWLCRNVRLEAIWEMAMRNAETAYTMMLDAGATPQEARSVLPFSLKTTIAATGTIDMWKHFISLRSANDAHPQIKIISDQIRTILQQLGYSE